MILVEFDKIYQVCMKLVVEGFLVGSILGYELLDKEQVFGISQFMEKICYYCSIEGELVCIIFSMNWVWGVCVYLVILKCLVFVNDNCKFSVLVFVELYFNQNFEKMQVVLIIYLVVFSIFELEDKYVIVVDQCG